MIVREVWLKIILNLIAFINLAKCECGLPGIPFNAQIDKLKHIYYEGDYIEYSCQLEGLKLLGNNTRKCVNSQWVGTIPRCVEELPYGTIKSIEIRKNLTKWSNEYSNAAYFGGQSKNNCYRSKRTQSWKLYFYKSQRHITYIEIMIYNRNNQFNENQLNKLIKNVKINELRECSTDTASIDSASSTVRVNVSCMIQFDGDSIYDIWERDIVQFIAIDFNYYDVTVCEIRLFSNSFMPFHRCGSADIVLHSTMEFIKSGNKYGRNSYYKYKCDNGFVIEGNEDIRCGLNNQWLDSFPSCRPLITCSYPPSDHLSTTSEVSYEYLYSYNGNITAISGSIVTYNCAKSNSIMLGDSVRVCGEDGNWSGVDAFCIDSTELTSDHYEQYIKNTKLNDTVFNAFSMMNAKEQQQSIGCGIPAMPYFAKPTSEKSRIFGSQSDIRYWYANGSIIHYQCESAYRWVTGDVDSRTCINGSWVGRVGKCAVNWGNKISLKSVDVYDLDNSEKSLLKHSVMETNDTSHWDEHFAYRRDPEKNNCATFTVDASHKWVLRLNQSTQISFFSVMLHPGGFFGFKRRINDANVLKDTPISAEVGERSCILSSAWDYTHGKIGTFFFFTCDMYESKTRFQNKDSFINIYIDPKKFDKSYKNSNISICSLAVMVSKNDCGTPDIPTHSMVEYNSAREEWVYTCDKGFELIGSSSVKCGRNGRWIDKFPVCRLYPLCTVSDNAIPELSVSFENLVPIKNKQSATKYSLSNYSCADDRALIGTSLRACTESGAWSGSQPQCIELSSILRIPESSGKSLSITAVVVGLFLLILLLVTIGLYFAYKREIISIPKLSEDPPTLRVEKADGIRSISGERVSNGTNAVRHSESNPNFCDINDELPAFPNGTEFLVQSNKHS